MFKILKKEINWGGKKLTLETGRIARQASGAVLATFGETLGWVVSFPTTWRMSYAALVSSSMGTSLPCDHSGK